MSWIDDSLPLPAARPVDGEEALEAAIHALAALAAGMAAMQLLSALVFGQILAAAFFAAALVATGACAFVSDRSALRRAAFLTGGCATVFVWLSMLPQAPGQPMVVVFAMAGVSAAVTRQFLIGDEDPSRGAVATNPSAPRVGWIEDDRDGMLTGGGLR